jgi:hypothetical protein
MSQQVSTHFVQAFADGITHLSQQEMSRLMSSVDVDNAIVGDRKFYDQLGRTAMSKRTSRHGDTEYTDTPHARRMITLESWDVADLVDTDDVVQLLNDPTNAYSRSFAMAAGRTLDDVIIEAATATAKTGTSGGTDETFPATGYNGATSTETVATNLTIAEVANAKEWLDSNEIPDEGRICVVDAAVMMSFVQETQIASSDFNTTKAQAIGTIPNYMGFNFVRSERLSGAAAAKELLFFHRDHLKLGIQINPRGRISELPTKRYSTQVFYEMRVGATRMSSDGVYRVIVDSTA